MKIKIEIYCDNAAFEQLDSEVYRILTELAERVSEFGVRMSKGNIMDTNGNTVGTFILTED